MSSAGKKVFNSAFKYPKIQKQKINELKTLKLGGLPVKLVKPHMPVIKSSLTKAMREQVQNELDSITLKLKITRPENFIEEIDTSFETFFNKREFTLDNFNLLLQSLSKKRKIDECLSIVDKMKIFGVVPNVYTYVHLIVACGKARDHETAEVLFNKAKDHLEEDLELLYSSLISSYAVPGNHEKILQLINEKKDKGFKDNVVDYTCYMCSLIKSGFPEKVKELYEEKFPYIQSDEFFLNTVIRSCSKTNDAEYALRIWHQLKGHGFAPVAYFYNEIIMALAKRKDYAQQALTMYKQMRGEMIVPDSRTFNGVLVACSRLGDLPEARLALRDMKEFDIEMDRTRYSLLLSIYGEACLDANEDAKNLFIKESWELFRLCQEKGWVDSMIVNSLLSVHTKAYFEKQVEGLVLPLYDQYGIKKDKHTYRTLLCMYNELCEYKTNNALWDAMKKQGVKPDMYILNYYLKSAIMTNDTDRVVEALESFKEHEYTPLPTYLSSLHLAENLPLRVWAALQEFKYFYSDDLNKKYSERIRIHKHEQRYTR